MHCLQQLQLTCCGCPWVSAGLFGSLVTSHQVHKAQVAQVQLWSPESFMLQVFWQVCHQRIGILVVVGHPVQLQQQGDSQLCLQCTLQHCL